MVRTRRIDVCLLHTYPLDAMKPPWNIIAALIWTAVVIGLILWLQHRHNETVNSLESVIREKEGKITYWKTEAGKTVSSKPAAEVLPSDVAKAYPELVEELKKELRIEVKQLRAVLSAAIEARGEGVVRIMHDTVRVTTGTGSSDSLFVNDGYLSLRAAIPGRYRYTYKDSLLWAVYDKKKWLLGNSRLYGDFRLSNPNAKALNQTSILIKKRDKRFVISAGVSYSIDGRLLPGVHCGFALIRL